ncbi:MAG: hypothetical protein RXS42_07545 [Nitrososphaeria archaeon]
MTERWRVLREYPEAEKLLQTMDSDPRVTALRAKMPEVYRELSPHRWMVAALERLPILAVREMISVRGEAAAMISRKLIVYMSIDAVVNLEPRDLAFVLAHEAMHALMADVLRSESDGLDQAIVSAVDDVRNNTMLRDAGITFHVKSVKYVEDILPGRRAEDVTFEELYEALAARRRAKGKEVVPGRTLFDEKAVFDVLGVVQLGDPDLYDEDPRVVARARRRWLRAVLRAPDLPPAVRRGIESGWADLLGARRGGSEKHHLIQDHLRCESGGLVEEAAGLAEVP